jgi:hypothetical protein
MGLEFLRGGVPAGSRLSHSGGISDPGLKG